MTPFRRAKLRSACINHQNISVQKTEGETNNPLSRRRTKLKLCRFRSSRSRCAQWFYWSTDQHKNSTLWHITTSIISVALMKWKSTASDDYQQPSIDSRDARRELINMMLYCSGNRAAWICFKDRNIWNSVKTVVNRGKIIPRVREML